MSTPPLPEMDTGPDFEGTSERDREPLACQFPDCGNTVVKPPRGRTPRFCDDHKRASTSRNTSSSNRSNTGKIEAGMTSLFNSIAVGCTGIAVFTSQPAWLADAQTITANSEAMARAWAEWAAVNPALRKWLERLLSGSGALGVVLATAPVAIGIAQNHTAPPNTPVTVEFDMPRSGEHRMPSHAA